jgi:hypothetical protein
MPAAKNDRIDALIKEVLKTEDQRFRGSDTLLALTKQALKVAVEQLADLERKTDVHAREVQRSTKRSTNEPVKSRKDVSKPMVDVDKEIAILKKEMATSLRNAAKEIEEEDADEEEEDTG